MFDPSTFGGEQIDATTYVLPGALTLERIGDQWVVSDTELVGYWPHRSAVVSTVAELVAFAYESGRSLAARNRQIEMGFQSDPLR